MKSINSEELKQLQNEGKTILVDFYASWCGPCKMLLPTLTSLVEQYPNSTFVKVDVDQNRDLLNKFSVQSVPTVVILKGEEIVHRSSGVKDGNYFKNVLNGL